MKTLCDIKKGDAVWAYDHGKVRERIVEYAYMGQDAAGTWHWCVKLSRCMPQEFYLGGRSKEKSYELLKQFYGRYGWFDNGYQKVWTDKDEMKKWLENLSNKHRHLHWKYLKMSRREEMALDKVVNVLKSMV